MTSNASSEPDPTSRAVLVEVQRRFSDANPELANGFAEHAPMGAEALLRLGVSADAVRGWSARHAPEPAPAPANLVATLAEIRAELAVEPWEEVLGRRLTPLVAHVDAHLFHGLIRTAHATRALADDDSPAGRNELAVGLAAWELWAERDATARPHADPVTAPGAEPLDRILDAAQRGAAAFVGKSSIFTLHAVTAPMAFMMLAPHLDAELHAVAAARFATTHARYPPVGSGAAPLPLPSDDELATLASQWDAHPAKLVEAALRGYAATEHPVFIHAARVMLPH